LTDVRDFTQPLR